VGKDRQRQEGEERERERQRAPLFFARAAFTHRKMRNRVRTNHGSHSSRVRIIDVYYFDFTSLIQIRVLLLIKDSVLRDFKQARAPRCGTVWRFFLEQLFERVL